MESVDFSDRYLDPPDIPDKGECDRCGTVEFYEDMHDTGTRWLCDECYEDCVESAREAENE